MNPWGWGGYTTFRGRGGSRQYMPPPVQQYYNLLLQHIQAPGAQAQTYLGNSNLLPFNWLWALEQGFMDEEALSEALIPPMNTPEIDQQSGKD